jgi:periplasmic copper chaperone A
MQNRSFRRAAVVAGLTAGALVLSAGAAAAHVTVNPNEETQGGYAKLAFRVPNESDTASTVKLQVQFPQDSPFASARVKPHEGWTAKIATSKLDEPVTNADFTIEEAVSSITWTAQRGVKIGPGEFDEFEVSVGPLPEKESLAFPAVQTYDDGEVVRWSEQVKEGAPEPEHPAPTLALLPAPAGGHGHGAEPAADTDETSAAQPAPQAASSNVDPTARALSAAGLGVAVLGLVAALFAAVGVRRKASG